MAAVSLLFLALSLLVIEPIRIDWKKTKYKKKKTVSKHVSHFESKTRRKKRWTVERRFSIISTIEGTRYWSWLYPMQSECKKVLFIHFIQFQLNENTFQKVFAIPILIQHGFCMWIWWQTAYIPKYPMYNKIIQNKNIANNANEHFAKIRLWIC